MRASNFKRFLKTLPDQITAFSHEADEKDGDDQWEMAIHRYSAARILAWILDNTGTTLRNHQLVKAWASIVTKCGNLEDFTAFAKMDGELILAEVKYNVQRFNYHKKVEAERVAQVATRKLTETVTLSNDGKRTVTRRRYEMAYQ